MTMRFNENNRTITGEVDKLLGTTGDGKLPAVDGSQLTNLNISSGSNSRSLSYVGAYGTVVTVNMARNSVYAVSSSGPQFTITSALRSSYVNGDHIYIVMFASTWCSLINSDTAGGTKLFVKGTETTNWRFQQTRGTIKLRLTTHTNGALYVHVCDDLSILDDLTDVVDTHNSVPVGATLKYNPYLGKWQAKQNWMPKVLEINNSNAIDYLSTYEAYQATWNGVVTNTFRLNQIDLSATKVSNVPSSPNLALHPDIAGWTNFFNDADFYNYDHFIIIIKLSDASPLTLYKDVGDGLNYTTDTREYEVTAANAIYDLNQPRIKLPYETSKWIGKKITIILDTLNNTTNKNPGTRPAWLLNKSAASTTTHSQMDWGDGNGWYSTGGALPGPLITNSDGSNYNMLGAQTWMLTDRTYMPLLPGGSGGTSYANTLVWVQVPF